MAKKKSILKIQDIDVTIATFEQNDYICITDMAKARAGDARAADVIKNWLRTFYFRIFGNMGTAL